MLKCIVQSELCRIQKVSNVELGYSSRNFIIGLQGVILSLIVYLRLHAYEWKIRVGRKPLNKHFVLEIHYIYEDFRILWYWVRSQTSVLKATSTHGMNKFQCSCSDIIFVLMLVMFLVDQGSHTRYRSAVQFQPCCTRFHPSNKSDIFTGLWKYKKCYFHSKRISIIDTLCSVVVNHTNSDWFPLPSGEY